MQNIPLTSGLLAAAAVLLLLLLLAPVVSTSSCDWDWLLYKDSCYAYYNQSVFWYDGEMTCKEKGGHLVSIADDQENRLVGKLSLCKSVWIGRYAKDLGRLADSAGYAWTDESLASAGGFSKHAFSSEPSIHKPLIRAEQLSWYNALYHEQNPFICKSSVAQNSYEKSECPSRMKFFQGHCYLFSGFEVNFIEANFYCQNHSTNLVSVLSEQELHFLNTLDLSTDACEIQPVWLGLVKLNPCNPDEDGRELCYQWTDFSGKHSGFPRWADGQPGAQGDAESGDQRQQNCVTLSGDTLVGSACNERHAFICKAGAASLTGDAFKSLDSPTAADQEARAKALAKATVTAESPGIPVASGGEAVEVKPPSNSSEVNQAPEKSESVAQNTTANELRTPDSNSDEAKPENETSPTPSEAKTEEPPNDLPKPTESTTEVSNASGSESASPPTAESTPKPVEQTSEQSAGNSGSESASPPTAESTPKPVEQTSEQSAGNATATAAAILDQPANQVRSKIKPRKDPEERLPWGLEELFNYDWQKAAQRSQ
ncbi:hypothetical protein BOX15_Mlig018359g1 [Macrostomum lignano]|uniref:C-type lectin domain-containing protein n=1 Tax=Macrostomum lignano TaxID=282301 RepID=A0A267H938_9PLAT|nr:hypothetical protein BOX15_Mlig018359g1 [Macrostomum lignano]